MAVFMYDIVIIGAGIVGGSIFRELSKYNLKILAVEKENDVAMGATKANSAIIHAGFDPPHGSLMAKYNVAGNKMYKELCEELDVPYENNGALVVAFDDKDLKTIESLLINGKKNGVPGLSILSKEETFNKEPNLNKNILGALYAKSSSIICPFQYTIALFENGIVNGGELLLNKEVTNIKKIENKFLVEINHRHSLETKFLINAAGVYADRIHNMILPNNFSIKPRMGEYILFNKNQGNLFKSTIFQCPSERGKGVLVSKTIHGNLFIGPDAVDIEEKDNTSTNKNGLKYIINMAQKTSTKINFKEPLKNYAGIRSVPSTDDFIIKNYDNLKNFVDVSGIKSPGLTCAPAIAKDVVEILKEAGLNLKENKKFYPLRKQTRFFELSEKEKNALIKKDCSFGKIICSCEKITEGEILDAIKRSFTTPTVCGIKRRCRAGMGKCQGNFCAPIIVDLISKKCKITKNLVLLDSKNSNILGESIG